MIVNIDPIVLEAIVNQEAYDTGIVPPNKNILADMGRPLSSLLPEVSRKLRRKFRKLWRKLGRQHHEIIASELIKCADIANRTGLGAEYPTRKQSLARKSVVYSELNRRARKKLSQS